MSSRSPEPKKPTFTFGPMEQALLVLIVMGFASNPSLPYAVLSTGKAGAIPLLTPPFIMLIIIAYGGYHILLRQEFIRTQAKSKSRSSGSSSSSSSRSGGSSSSSSRSGGSSSSSGSSGSSSSSGKPLSSKDIRSGGLPSSKGAPPTGDPKPKQVSSAHSGDPRTNPSHKDFKQNYFLTMQGPGRPALVPFQPGLRPAAGEPEGSMWWNNVPDDPAILMAPPVDGKAAAAAAKNPWLAEMLEKDVDMLKLKKRKAEEAEKYEKVGAILQTFLGAMLCLVDMRLGLFSFVFFLWRHFSQTHEKVSIDKEKSDLYRQMSEGKKNGSLTKEQFREIEGKFRALSD